MMRIFPAFILLIAMLACGTAFAQQPAPTTAPGMKKLGGDQFELGIGSAVSSVENPDGTKANFEGIGLIAGARIPLIGSRQERFEFALIGSMIYYDLKNNVEINGENETMLQLGPGGGIYARLYWFTFGYQLDYLVSRQYATGLVSREINYDMIASRMFYGIDYKVWRQYGVGLSLSNSSGKVPAAKSGLSTDSAFKNTTIWLNLTYSTGN